MAPPFIPPPRPGSARPHSGGPSGTMIPPSRPLSRSGSTVGVAASGPPPPMINFNYQPQPPPPRQNYYNIPLDQFNPLYAQPQYPLPPPPPGFGGYPYEQQRRGSLPGYPPPPSPGPAPHYFDSGRSPILTSPQTLPLPPFSAPGFHTDMMVPAPIPDDLPFNFYPEDLPEGGNFEELEEEAKKKPKTPPDMCAVCGVTSTPEWRKGPAGIRSLCNGCGLLASKRSKERQAKGFAQPTTIDHMQRELQAIGAERFKSPNGEWNLPPNTRQRILETIDRTNRAAQSMVPRAGRKLKAADRQAAGALLGMSRRGSVSGGSASAMAPLSMPSGAGGRGRRAGSMIERPVGRPPSGGNSTFPTYPSNSFSGATLLNPNYPTPPVYSTSLRSTGTPGPSNPRRSWSPGPSGMVRGRSPSPISGSKMSLGSITNPGGSILPLPPPPPGMGNWNPAMLASRGRSPSPGPPPGMMQPRSNSLIRAPSPVRPGPSISRPSSALGISRPGSAARR